MLGIYNLQLDSSPQVGRTNARRIEAIRAVQSKPVTRLLEGAPVRGMQTVVELEESNFSSWGDAHTFGAVLDALLAEHVGLNSFNELVISLHPSQVNYRWNAKNGQKTIL